MERIKEITNKLVEAREWPEFGAGDTITVAYADPSGSNDTKAVQDSEGNDATTLGSTSVTNNTKIGLYGALVQIRGEEYRDAVYKNTSIQ